MDKEAIVRREKALKELKRYGIEGPEVYLIDLIPLIEMIWADGKAQEGEVEILEDYIPKQIDHINKMAGYQIMNQETANSFVHRFMHTRPDPELLKTLREFIAPLRLSTSDHDANEALRSSLLATCIDIAASCVLEYPYGISERFNPDEKLCYFEILESLN